jgi:hypothetical protein
MKRATRKSSKSVALKKSASTKRPAAGDTQDPKLMLDLAARYHGGSLTAKQREDVEAWALTNIDCKAVLGRIAVELALRGGTPYKHPEPPPPVSDAQRHAVWAYRLKFARDIVSDVGRDVCGVVDQLSAVATLAGEFEYLSDDGPGKKAKARATATALAALGQSGKHVLDGAWEQLDALWLRMNVDVRAEHVAEMKEAQTEGGEHGES